MKYRIIKCPQGFLPQYKGWFIWKDIQRPSQYGNITVYYPQQFNAESAINYFKTERMNRKKPEVVFQSEG